MSIGSILNMARQGMAAQQTAIHTASQNIANAETVGYSRQRVELEASLSAPASRSPPSAARATRSSTERIATIPRARPTRKLRARRSGKFSPCSASPATPG